jgi:hypothetical protein
LKLPFLWANPTAKFGGAFLENVAALRVKNLERSVRVSEQVYVDGLRELWEAYVLPLLPYTSQRTRFHASADRMAAEEHQLESKGGPAHRPAADKSEEADDMSSPPSHPKGNPSPSQRFRIQAADMEIIFGEVDVLLATHEALLAELKAAPSFNAVFALNHCAQVLKLESYAKHCAGFVRAVRTVEQLQDQLPYFSEFLQSQQLEYNCSDVVSCLAKTVARLDTYVSFFQEALACLAPTTAEATDTTTSSTTSTTYTTTTTNTNTNTASFGGPEQTSPVDPRAQNSAPQEPAEAQSESLSVRLVLGKLRRVQASCNTYSCHPIDR